MKFKYCLFIIMILVVSCKKDKLNVDCSKKTNDIENVRILLPGSYTWAYSRVWIMGNAPFTETPINTGMRYKYVFDRKGFVDYFENDLLKSHDKYVIDYEFKITSYPSDSATIVIIQDKQTGQRKEFFRPWLCNDSARFYNPYSSFDVQRYFARD